MSTAASANERQNAVISRNNLLPDMFGAQMIMCMDSNNSETEKRIGPEESYVLSSMR